MAWCIYCEQEMTDEAAVSCARDGIRFPDDTLLQAVPFWDRERCPDCGIKSGGVHHPGCDQEDCPRCNCQIISCGCLEEKK